MTSREHDDPAALPDAARRISASLVEGLQLRLSLFALELDEERQRLARKFVALLGLALTLFMFLLCLNAALLIVFWDTHRVQLVLGMCGFYLTMGIVLTLWWASLSRRQVAPFAASRAVLEADQRLLRERR